MKIALTNWERFWLGIIVGSAQCPTIQIVRLGNKVLDKLELSAEEKALVGWQQLSPRRIGWNPTYENHEWGLEFTEDEWALLQGRVQAFQGWPQDRRVEGLYEKILGKEEP